MSDMEITPNDIAEAQALRVLEEYDTYLERFKEWSSLSLDDLALGKIKSDYHQLSQDAYRLKYNLSSTTPAERETALITLAQIINFQKRELTTAFKDNSIADLLTFLETHRLLNLPLATYMDPQHIDATQKEHLAQSILDQLSRYSFDVSAEAEARYQDKQWLIKYQQGIEEENVNKIYSFVESMENTKGIRFPYRIGTLLRFLYEIDFNAFSRHIAAINSPLHFVAALEWMSAEQLLKLVKDYPTTNKWFLYEVLRQLQEKPLSNESSLVMQQLLSTMYDIDQVFFIQTCKFNRGYKEFNSALGACLANITELEPELIKAIFEMDQYTFALERKDILLSSFLDQPNNQVKEVLLSTVYKMWEDYANAKLQERSFSIGHPLLTSYVNFVITYLNNFQPLEERKQLWKDKFQAIADIDVEWYVSRSHRLARFMVLFGSLSLYTFSMLDEGLPSDIRSRLETLLMEPILIKRYLSDSPMNNVIMAKDIVRNLKEKLNLSLTWI